MKKFFSFAAALCAAITINAEVIDLQVVNNESADAAKESFEAAFDLTNITINGVANNSGDSYYAEVVQTEASTDWETTLAEPKASPRLYFAFKDSNAGKLVMKAYSDYVQPNGKAVCLVIKDLEEGQEVTLTLKKALNKEAMVEGATVEACNFESTEVVLVATGGDMKIYSKSAANSEAKWQLQTVAISGTKSGLETIAMDAKAQKIVENGQIYIIRNGERYNVLGAKVVK